MRKMLETLAGKYGAKIKICIATTCDANQITCASKLQGFSVERETLEVQWWPGRRHCPGSSKCGEILYLHGKRNMRLGGHWPE